ncbi:tellurite resistance TerB family protein [Desertifilum sp. FACHB-1129]|uniref:Tellurite resistance protein TerB n=1 Tax=Desertifilum tharense IPPAS B-1220 TaxID=1781255 RepID=A0A1E5QF55_9CYAN|nr:MULTISPECIES: tellurite resistance TerB family protein [Desertifilum]MCD8488142.1 tellurite resistance TerB family protein [Desertifilum sp.]MDA0208881.1 tellurite resistance TerB family protein [Cyanobacteria bacterium FC1]MDI9635212.1 tellurite resistance TerB family protein [Geitlerinema splendidum]MBD2314984.1 tellurite resistance TerB family protein [Desertifilum sp. FACHB-1129]MBD2321487.1 tellurite resistance TerB family protein [Desertifilum sp. FACHB-866]
MGLFDKLRGNVQKTETTLGPAEAFAAIALIAVASDGYITDTECQALSTTLARMQLFRSYPNDVMRRMFDKLLSILQREGLEVLFNAATAALPHDLKETAFAVTTDIVLADGQVTSEEEKLLNDLYRVLEIPEDLAVKIIDVMLIKNKG